MDSDRHTASGRPAELPDDNPAPAPVDPTTKQHKDHWVLSPDERSKGWVRPYREKYVHTQCGVVTRMSVPIAETYAKNPNFYGETFCVSCKVYRPVLEFKWDGTEELVGS